MRRFVMLALLVILGVMTWRLGSSLSSDALGMAVGVVFGVLAGIPAALLVLATNSRRREHEEEERDERYERYQQRQDRQLPAYPYQPPVIVVAGAQAPQAAPPPLGPGPVLCAQPDQFLGTARAASAALRSWASAKSGSSERVRIVRVASAESSGSHISYSVIR